MRLRTSIAAAGAAVALAGAGAILLPAVASAHSTTHTLKFTAISLKGANFSSTDSGQAEQDVNSAGKTIGFDVANFAFNPATNTATGRVALTTKGGFLYGKIKTTNGPKTAVTITYSN